MVGAYLYGISGADRIAHLTASLDAIEDDRSSVTVKVTPLEIGEDAERWEFMVAFDTHSVDLDHDPTLISILVDDAGNIHRPTGWEGPGPGGHHREGVLFFEPMVPLPGSIELRINGVGDDSERSFKWEL